MSKAYYRVSEFQQEVLDNRTKTFERGFEIGFHSAYNYLNLKKENVAVKVTAKNVSRLKKNI